MKNRKPKNSEKNLKKKGWLSHFICDLSTEFGMDDIRRVCDWRVPEVVRLLTVLFLLQKEQLS